MTESEVVGDIAQQETLLLDTRVLSGIVCFRAYLEQHKLSPLEVSIASKVRYLTVWNILHGNPITSTHEAQVRWGLYHLTGVPFTALLVTRTDTKTDEEERLHQVSHYDEESIR